jgi:type I restriction enzyme S subunit
MNKTSLHGWQEYKLGEICSDISYGYTERASLNPIGPKFLRITDIVPGRVDWETVPYCKISSENREKYHLQSGDIVIARTGATTGFNYTIKPADVKHDSVFASYLIRYRIDIKKADPFFIGHLLTSTIWKGFVEGISGGSAQPGANAKQFAVFDVLLPPLPEQRAIAGVLSSLDEKIDLLYRQNKTLESMAEALYWHFFVNGRKVDWKECTVNEIAKHEKHNVHPSNNTKTMFYH